METATDNLPAHDNVGVVVIGRNEGERLIRCLESVRSPSRYVVYVDSGSSDGSVEAARQLGAAVVDLDMTVPFTAARARNAGFTRLMELAPDLTYVYFVDGDCEVYGGWIDTARAFLDARSQVAVVWGQRRERYPERSIYNTLCEIEWRSFPLGETKYCGGDALMRTAAFREVNGYTPTLICGEEPELCIRMRQKGWRIWHVDEDMTLHDAAIYRFSQWWKRMLRGGYGFAQGAALHGAPPERHWVRESRRAWFWGLGMPTIVVAATVIVGWWGLLLAAVYPLQLIRLASYGRRYPEARWHWAGAMVLGRFAEMLGQMKYLFDRARRVQSKLIEYK